MELASLILFSEEKMKKTISNLCWVGCVICAVIALNNLGRDDSEVADYADADLPLNAFMAYERIGHEYGTFAADYWRYAVYGSDPSSAKKILGPFLKDKDMEAQLRKATQANFQVPPDTKRDEQILRRYKSLRSRDSDLHRRTMLSQRFKDMMAYIGGAAVLGFIAYFLGKSAEV